MLRKNCAALAFGLCAGLPGTNVLATTVGYGDRVNFLDAVGPQPIVEDNFNYGIAAAEQIVFASGVTSTSPGANNPARNTVFLKQGWYNNHLSNSEPNVSISMTWEFPVEITGFGMDFLGGPINVLEVSFLGQLFLPDAIPGSDDNNFFGYLSDQPFQSVTFSTSTPINALGFTADNLVFVPATPAVVPLPASIALFLTGLGGFLAFGRPSRDQNC